MPDSLSSPPANAPAAKAPPALATAAQRSNARVGVILFLVYFLLYVGFVYLSAFRADLMGKPALAGINLAVIYGFGLIFAAFVLAVIYMALCRNDGGSTQNGGGGVR